ncbi:unnamed protein product [Aphanomyces euteiches]|uniref:Uncharacterized protein n=1 Tax=Aphanomyces euteiches TaxID=100861 RepID=A0A6G0WKY3_9STRA|nr:hypothetical protein Ae201684_014075 [Aphanomyces euteiches]KAH9096345.1 hypothetical protein Ae201684P_009575 [Aphanomyces euteiches]
MDAAEDWLSVPPTHGLISSSNKVKEVDSKRGRSNSSTKDADSKQRQIEEKPSLTGNQMIVVPAPTVDIQEPNRRESMAINSINQTIKTLDLKLVEKKLQKRKFYLRDASLSDWEAFFTSEDQQLKSKNMEWMEGKIFIVELPSLQHDEFVAELYSVLRDATHTGTKFLRIALAAYQTNVRRLEPDLCLLPHRVLGQPPYNVQLPPGVDWDDFHTVKWEVAWSKTWADLDWKANQWATAGTVIYIICIKLEPPNLVNCSYKVHHVVNHGVNMPAMVPISIAAPKAVVHLDSRLVLQLPAISPLPPNFAPQLDIDLFAPLAVLLANLPPATAAI